MIKKFWAWLTGGPDLHEVWGKHDCAARGCYLGKPPSQKTGLGVTSDKIEGSK